MLFGDLLKVVEPLKVCGEAGIEIQGLCFDSRQLKPGDLFFALKGSAVDGHTFIRRAMDMGAAAIVAEDGDQIPSGSPHAVVADSRRAMALMSALFYGNPTNRLPLVGITGTNGKTTTSYIVEGILEEAGLPTSVLGTVSYRFRDSSIPAPHTTPESVELQRVLKEMVEMGAKAMVMEVSSHALDQRRVDGCRFDVGIFTNLTRDHLDYHYDMDSYLSSKMRLFSELLLPDVVKPQRNAAVNIDDPCGRLIAAAALCPVITYGLGAEAALTARDVNFSVDGITALLVTPRGEGRFHSWLPGRFNLYNILAAAAAATALGIPLQTIIAGIASHRKVPGRLERVENDRGIAIFVDYAHTGDALENVLATLKELAQGRIITVFGCGGDRDRGKRPLMGEVAGRLSDLAVVTSDNPRTEEPAAIMAEIRTGIASTGIREYQVPDLNGDFVEKGFVMVQSRRDAIGLAVRLARRGDIVLLAGKGHEDYQIIGREKHHFDDREEARAALAAIG